MARGVKGVSEATGGVSWRGDCSIVSNVAERSNNKDKVKTLIWQLEGTDHQTPVSGERKGRKKRP